jgi:signal transduction histidine kinase
MTLHEAIEKILLEAEGPLPAGEIASLISLQKLYTKKDGSMISGNQIILRAKNYKEQFDVLNNLISLKKNVELSNVIKEYKNLLQAFGELPNLNRDYIALFLLFVKRLLDTGDYQSNISGAQGRKIGSGSENVRRLTGIIGEVQNDLPLLSPISGDTIHLLKERLPSFKAEEAIHYFESIKTSKLKDEEFIGLFNRLISETENYNNKIPLCTSAGNLRELLSKIFTPAEGDTVFDPFLGVAGQFIQLQQRCNYGLVFSGQEINSMAAALAAMNLKISGINELKISSNDSFAVWDEEKFDYIISDPPFLGNTRITLPIEQCNFSSVLDSNGKVRGTVAPYLYILEKMNSTGRAAFTVPESLLFADGPESKFREVLIENDLLEVVIGLPQSFSGKPSGLKVNLIILNKGKNQKGDIQFIDFDGSKHQDADILQKILELYETKKATPNSYIIKTQEIAKEGYSLLARRYNPKLKSLLNERIQLGRNLVKLSELTTKIKLEAAPFGTELLYVNSLYSEALNGFELKTESLKSITVEEKGYYLLNESAILIDKSGIMIQARIFQYSNEPILLGSHLLALKLTTHKTSEKFLCFRLNEDLLTKYHVWRYYRGTSTPFLAERNLLEMLIDLPSINEQNEVLIDYLSNLPNGPTEKGVKSYKLVVTDEQASIDIIPTLKHTISQPIATIRDGVHSLKHFLIGKASRNELLNLTENIAPNLPDSDPDKSSYTLINQLELISNNAALVQQYLQRVEGLINLDSYLVKSEKFDVREFLEEILANQFVIRNCKIQVEGGGITVKTDKQLLTAVVQNIIQNAIKHGFPPESEKDKNILRIILTRENFGIMDVDRGELANLLSISFENNGIPIDSSLIERNQYKKEELKSNLEAKGGFGLIFIKKILKKLEGNLNIRQVPEDSLDNFKTKFTVILSLN